MVLLELAKNGLANLLSESQSRRNGLLARLAKKEQLNEEDEHWLDHSANFVEETALLDLLQDAQDFEATLLSLNTAQKTMFELLLAAGGPGDRERGTGDDTAEGGDKNGAKRKRESSACNPLHMYETHVNTGPNERKVVPQNEKNPSQKHLTKTSKSNAELRQRIEILDWHNANGKNQTKTAKHWAVQYPDLRINQPLISSWIKKEDYWRQQYSESLERGGDGSAKRQKQTEHPEVTEMLELWVTKAMNDNISLSGDTLRQKWTRFADMLNIPQDERLMLSGGWLDSFKKRCGLKNFKRYGEASSANPDDIEVERDRIKALIAESGYALRDIFNMDETGLLWG
jgi:hypothetical protein